MVIVGKATPEPVVEVVTAPTDMRFCALTTVVLALVLAVVSTGLADVLDIPECEIEEFGVVHA